MTKSAGNCRFGHIYEEKKPYISKCNFYQDEKQNLCCLAKSNQILIALPSNIREQLLLNSTATNKNLHKIEGSYV